jgi:endonuclease-3 related protein
VSARANPGSAGVPPAEPGVSPGAHLLDIYDRLLAHFGPLHWWPAESPFEVIVGAVLTQNTAWTNVEKAIATLKAGGPLTRDRLLAMPETELAQAIRSSGTYTVKAARLRAVLEWLGEDWEDRLASADLVTLREGLLGVRGIGPETADSILLYAANRPAFVIDAYTRRILGRLGIEPADQTYEGYQRLFMNNLPRDPALFNEYHAQLIYLGKNHCRTVPRCGGCPLLELCPSGRPA